MSSIERTLIESDDPRIGKFIRALPAGRARIDAADYWAAFNLTFPHRGVEGERLLLLGVLKAASARGWIRLPAPRGKLWDTFAEPPLPRAIFRPKPRAPVRSDEWRRFAWHPKLQWVLHLPSLSAEQEALLRRVHEGLVSGAFAIDAPLRYRSLELTGDEKKLIRMASSKTLFGPGRLTRELLGCMREPTPFAWVSVGQGTRALAIENVGPFHAALQALRRMKEPPFGLVIYGAGGGFRRSVRYTVELGREVSEVAYLGDLDPAGVRIAADAARIAAARGLPPVGALRDGHEAMLLAARRFGHTKGWPRRSRPGRELVEEMEFLPEDVRPAVTAIFRAGRRVPEEVLGPADWDSLLDS